MLPFEFVIDGPPVSSQTNNRENLRKWRKELKNKAKSHWPEDELPVGDSVMVEITYFYEKGPPKIDVDNMSKPILDALEDVVYKDDVQVTDLLCQKRRLEDISVENSSDMLLELLMTQEGEFLFIVVQDAPDQEVFNG